MYKMHPQVDTAERHGEDHQQRQQPCPATAHTTRQEEVGNRDCLRMATGNAVMFFLTQSQLLFYPVGARGAEGMLADSDNQGRYGEQVAKELTLAFINGPVDERNDEQVEFKLANRADEGHWASKLWEVGLQPQRCFQAK